MSDYSRTFYRFDEFRLGVTQGSPVSSSVSSSVLVVRLVINSKFSSRLLSVISIECVESGEGKQDRRLQTLGDWILVLKKKVKGRETRGKENTNKNIQEGEKEKLKIKENSPRAHASA